MPRRLNSFNLAPRLALGFGLVLVLVLAISSVGILALQRGQADSGHVVRALQNATDADRWRGMTQLNISRTLALAKSGNNSALKAYFEPLMKQTSGDISALQKHLEGDVALDGAKAIFDDIATKRKRYVATREQVFKALDGSDPSATTMVERDLLPRADDYMSAVRDFGDRERLLADQVVADSDAQAGRARMATILLAAISLATGALCAWLITRSITSPLKEAVEAVGAVAAGDLRRKIEVRGKDEVATLLANLGRMQASLHQVVGEVRGSTDSITVASNEVAQGS